MLKRVWSYNLHFLDHSIAIFSFIGLFDDIRREIKPLLNTKSPDWLYHVKFLHLSVAIPCFTMGLLLARKMPFTKATNEQTTEIFRNIRARIIRNYECLGLVFASKIVVDFFQLLKDMTEEKLSNIDIRTIVPNRFFSHSGDLVLAKYGSLYYQKDKFVMKKGAGVEMDLDAKDNLSPVLRLLPLLLIDIPFLASKLGPEEKETFGKPKVPLKEWFSYKEFFQEQHLLRLNSKSLGSEAVIDITDAVKVTKHWDTLSSQQMFPDDFNMELALLKISSLYTQANVFYFHFTRDLKNLLEQCHQHDRLLEQKKKILKKQNAGHFKIFRPAILLKVQENHLRVKISRKCPPIMLLLLPLPLFSRLQMSLLSLPPPPFSRLQMSPKPPLPPFNRPQMSQKPPLPPFNRPKMPLKPPLPPFNRPKMPLKPPQQLSNNPQILLALLLPSDHRPQI